MSKQNLEIEDLEKALSTFFSEEEIDDLLSKAKKAEETDLEEPEAENEIEPEMDEENGDDVEKAFAKKQAEYSEMEKAFNKKKKELLSMQEQVSKSKKSKAPSLFEVSKADKDELVKSIANEISGIVKAENNDLRKSLEDALGEISDLKKSIGEIGGAPTGRRAVVRESQIIEKADTNEISGKNGRQVRFGTQEIEKSLTSMIEKANSTELRDRYEMALLRLNSGGIMPSEYILNEIQKSEGIVFVK